MNRQYSWENTWQYFQHALLYSSWIFFIKEKGALLEPQHLLLQEASALQWADVVSSGRPAGAGKGLSVVAVTEQIRAEMEQTRFPHSWSVRPWEESLPQVHTSAVPLFLAALTNFAESLPELCHLLLGEVCCRGHFLLLWVAGLQGEDICVHLVLFGVAALMKQRGFYLGFQSSGAACRSWKPSFSLYPEIKWRDKILCRWDTIPCPSCCFARPCSKLQQFYLY